jgi:hypothetical protein
MPGSRARVISGPLAVGSGAPPRPASACNARRYSPTTVSNSRLPVGSSAVRARSSCAAASAAAWFRWSAQSADVGVERDSRSAGSVISPPGLTLAAEVVDWRRFPSARGFMGFTGLVPAEYSSGERTRRGSITKAGSEPVRTALIEAAWAYRFPARDRPHAAASPARRRPGYPGSLLAGAAPALRQVQDHDRPRQARRRSRHRDGPRAGRLRLGRDDQLMTRSPSRWRPAGTLAAAGTTPRAYYRGIPNPRIWLGPPSCESPICDPDTRI